MVESAKKFAVLITQSIYIHIMNSFLYCILLFKKMYSLITHTTFFLGTVTTVLHLKTKWFQLLN